MMKNIRLSALLLAALSGSLMAQTVATVNGKAIDSSEIDAVVQNLKQGNPQLQDGPQLREEITRRLVVSTAVAQEARRLKLDQSNEFKQISDQALANAKKDGADKKPTFKQEWALFQNDLLNRAFMSDVLQKNPVGDADVNKAYQDMSAYYKGTQEIQLGEIMTRNEADAKKAPDLSYLVPLLEQDFKTIYDYLSPENKRSFWRNTVRQIHLKEDGTVDFAEYL